MKLAALPLDIAYASPADNCQAAAAMLATLEPGTDIAILPELFSTGFVRKPERLAQLAEGPEERTAATLRRWAQHFNLAIAGSYLATDGEGGYLNRAFFVEPSGETYHYDKRHLFTHSGEDRVFRAGTRPSPVIRYRGWNFKLFVCYDLRFPAWCRNTGLQYDVMLLPANWPDTRRYAFDHLLIARAIENQAYVVGANRSGIDPWGEYPAAMTNVYNYWGDPIGVPDAAGRGPVYATLSRQELDTFRNDFPVWRDADKLSLL